MFDPGTRMKSGGVVCRRRVGEADRRSGKGHDSGVPIPEGDAVLSVEGGTGVCVEADGSV